MSCDPKLLLTCWWNSIPGKIEFLTFWPLKTFSFELFLYKLQWQKFSVVIRVCQKGKRLGVGTRVVRLQCDYSFDHYYRDLGPPICWETFYPIYDKFKPVIWILVNVHVATRNFSRKCVNLLALQCLECVVIGLMTLCLPRLALNGPWQALVFIDAFANVANVSLLSYWII